MALHEVHAELEQDCHFVGVLDAFGNRLDLALLRRCGNLADAFLQCGIGRQRMHEFAVDLDVVRFENIEDLEAILVNPVVLKRKLDADLSESIGRFFRFLDVLGCFLLRDLHAQMRRIQFVFVEFRLHPVNEGCVLHRLPGQFDKDLFSLVFRTEFN